MRLANAPAQTTHQWQAQQVAQRDKMDATGQVSLNLTFNLIAGGTAPCRNLPWLLLLLKRAEPMTRGAPHGAMCSP